MKILIIYDKDTNEICYYIPEHGEHPVFIQPRKERKPEENEEDNDDESVH